MNILGINALNHDTSVCVFNNKLLFHKKSSDSLHLTNDLVSESLKYGKPDVVAWYENPYLKKTRQLFAGQILDALSYNSLPYFYLKKFNLSKLPIKYVRHHISHASYGVYSSSFTNSCILVVDAIGEWHTVTLWYYQNKKYKLILQKKYPYSLGLFYSSFTELIGYTPVRDESKLTELSTMGDANKFYTKVKKYLTKNLHKGIWDWEVDTLEQQDIYNIAASVQRIFEEEIINFASEAKKYSDNLVFTGGCAYNKVIRKKLETMFSVFHVPDLPGDSGSSIGAAYFLHCLYNK